MSVGVQGRTVAAPAADAARVAAIRNNLDLKDPGRIAAFGDRARQELAASVQRLVVEARAEDLTAAGDLLRRASAQIRNLDPADLQPRGGFDNIFNGRTARLHRFRRAVDAAWSALQDTAGGLQQRGQKRESGSEALNRLHEQTRSFILEVDAYIEAGRLRLAEARAAAAPAEVAPVEDVEPATEAQPAAGPAPVADLSVAERLSARLEDLERARYAALRQLPLVRLVQNADACIVDNLSQAQRALSNWRQAWTELLRAGGADRRSFRPHIPALAEEKLTALTALTRATDGLEEARTRRAEAEARMKKAAEALDRR